MPSITAILPAYNERLRGSVVLRALTPRRHKGIVVDDGSQDRMAEVAALRTGFAAADGADVIVTIDTDGQHSLTDVSSSYAPYGAQHSLAKAKLDLVPLMAHSTRLLMQARAVPLSGAQHSLADASSSCAPFRRTA